MENTFYNGFIHGGDYNPEQWLYDPEILETDIKYLKKAHINEVSLGIFSWAMLEPEENQYDFTWMESIINRLYENGISVILATPSGARPKWMADKYPEVLRVDESRNRYLYGLRHNHCYTSPVYREKTRKINMELANRFGKHPGVIAWHISNPMLYMFRAGFEKKLRTFIENGGIALMTYWSGIVDDTDLCYLGGTPYGLMDVFGLRSTEIDALYDWESNVSIPIEGNTLGLSGKWNCKNLCDIVKVSTAEVLGVYGQDFYEGMPTITQNQYGKGFAYYVCADFEQGFYDELISKIVGLTNIKKPVDVIPKGVEITTRKSEQNEYIFVQNYNDHEVNIELKNVRIILGKYEQGKMKEFETIVIKK